MARGLRRISWPAVLGGAGTGLALLLAVSLLISVSDLTHQNCQQIENVKGRIRTVISTQLQTLGQPGSPGYAYYAAHPAELASARADTRTSLHTFRPGGC